MEMCGGQLLWEEKETKDRPANFFINETELCLSTSDRRDRKRYYIFVANTRWIPSAIKFRIKKTPSHTFSFWAIL